MVMELLSRRISVRKFTAEPVPEEILKELCRCGASAPSACNMRDWRFTIITDDSLKKAITDAGGSVLIANSPAGILVSYARDTKNSEYRDDIQSASAAVENILLAAPEFGLGACWICNLPNRAAMRRILKMPKLYDPAAYIILGYPMRQPKRPPSKISLEDMIGVNEFPANAVPRSYSAAKVRMQRAMIFIYKRLPLWVKKLVFNKLIDAKFTKKFDD